MTFEHGFVIGKLIPKLPPPPVIGAGAAVVPEARGGGHLFCSPCCLHLAVSMVKRQMVGGFCSHGFPGNPQVAAHPGLYTLVCPERSYFGEMEAFARRATHNPTNMHTGALLGTPASSWGLLAAHPPTAPTLNLSSSWGLGCLANHRSMFEGCVWEARPLDTSSPCLREG